MDTEVVQTWFQIQGIDSQFGNFLIVKFCGIEHKSHKSRRGQ